MCGIAGIWGDATPERLKAMGDALGHRGPDDEGYWTQHGNTIGFAHRRLSIIDLQGGRQPISSEDGRIVTVFNGAIYNYVELRDELLGRGHTFKTQSDTEVIIHLYEEHGVDMAAKLRGMFAIAIWDDVQNQLVLIRDRVGKKPLYYSETNGEFIFASQIRGIVAASRVALALDLQSVADYLAWCCIPAPATVYRRVSALKPGEFLIARDRRVVQKGTCWRQRMLPKVRISPQAAVEQVDELLGEAVRLRLRADVPVGTFLSGGIDSGIVTAVAAREHPGRLTTITVGFEEEAFDERPLAGLVAKRYGTDHHEVLIKPDVAGDLARIVDAYDQPFGDASAIPSYYVARAARQFTKVVLNGDGGDELFAGYRRYLAARIAGLLSWADGPDSRLLWRTLVHVLPAPRRFRSPYAFVHRLIRGMGLGAATRYLAWAVDGIDEAGLRKLCRDSLHSSRTEAGLGRVKDDSYSSLRLGGVRVEQPDRLAKGVLDALGHCGPVDRMMGADFATILPFDLLVKMDIATMTHGLEARSPFLDHELIETVSCYPERIKLPGFVTKPLLRELSSRYLPEVIRHAPKRGFEVPLVRWLSGELRELCADVILDHNGLLADLFDRKALERLIHARGKGFPADGRLDPARWSRWVWTLLMLGMWDRVVYKNRPQKVQT